MALNIKKNTMMRSLDGNLVIGIKVLKLIIVALFLLSHYFCLIGQPVSKFWLYGSWFRLLKHFVEIGFFSSIILIYWKVHCSLFGARLWNVSLFKDIGEGFISGHFADFYPIRSIFINLARCSFKDDLVFWKILVNGATQFLHFLCLFVPFVDENCEEDNNKACSKDYENLLWLLHGKAKQAPVVCEFL